MHLRPPFWIGTYRASPAFVSFSDFEHFLLSGVQVMQKRLNRWSGFIDFCSWSGTLRCPSVLELVKKCNNIHRVFLLLLSGVETLTKRVLKTEKEALSSKIERAQFSESRAKSPHCGLAGVRAKT